MTHEEAFIRRFVDRRIRPRYLQKLETDRQWLLNRLHVITDADRRFLQDVTGPLGEPGRIDLYETLKQLGAPDTCYLIGGELDGRELPLAEAIDKIYGLPSRDQAPAVILSCVPGRLAYVESAEGRFILSRTN